MHRLTRLRRTRGLPILQHPGDEPALIEPVDAMGTAPRVPARCVLCFFREVLRKHEQQGRLRQVHASEGEGDPNPIFITTDRQEPITVVWPGLCAPYAATTLEELIAMGARSFIACGGAGALDPCLAVGHLIVPTAALRQEGTSYHYQREGRFSYPHQAAVHAIRNACQRRGAPFVEGITWTTDAIFRETPRMIQSRRQDGCLTVEMEAAALFAVAAYRNVVLGQILYAGDDVSGAQWDHRNWLGQTSVREALFELALDSCERISP